MVTSFIWSQCIANRHSEWKAIIFVQDTLAFGLAMESPNLSSLCLATFEFLGGWPLLRVLATCRAARGCEPWANKAFETLQVLAAMKICLDKKEARFPGMGLPEKVGYKVLPLEGHPWAQPQHEETYFLCIYSSMCCKLPFVASNKFMKAWVDRHPIYKGWVIEDILRDLNQMARLQGDIEILVNALTEGCATWHYGPPEAAGLITVPTPATAFIPDGRLEKCSDDPVLFIIFSLSKFPAALCLCDPSKACTLEAPKWASLG